MKTIISFIVIFFLNNIIWGQQITAEEKEEAVERISKLIESNYVFPDKGRKIAFYLRKQKEKGAYHKIRNYQVFLNSISEDIQKTHKDLHMFLEINPKEVKLLKRWKSDKNAQAEFEKEKLKAGKLQNFGFKSVEKLKGNIGYVDFRFFFPISDDSRNTVAAAMTSISKCDVIIIDLRNNGGGDPEMVQLITSYFFDPTPIHYNSIYNRAEKETKDFYTLSEVEGPRMPNVELYILTSNRTFSGAEEFAYNLQSLNRAVIVGEITRGGAHPVRPFIVNESLVLYVPIARSINAITRTNWEGKGVIPEVLIDEEKALLKAQSMALSKLVASSGIAREKTLLEEELKDIIEKMENF